MFKLILIAAMAAFADAQVAEKPAPKETTKQTAPARMKFTPEEIDKLSLYNAQYQVIRDKDKADELEKSYRAYQQDIAPVAAKQQAIIEAKCLAVGVPKETVSTGGCGVTFGIDASGNEIKGPDGKPIESEVWRIEQKTPRQTAPAEKK